MRVSRLLGVVVAHAIRSALSLGPSCPPAARPGANPRARHFHIAKAGGTTVRFNMTGVEGLAGADLVIELAGVVCAVDASQIGEYRSQYLCDWDGVDCTGLGVAPPVLDALDDVDNGAAWSAWRVRRTVNKP